MLHKRSLTALMVTALTIGSAAAFDDALRRGGEIRDEGATIFSCRPIARLVGG